jgi:sugar/nucleoside kinase (ribokinase family)
MADRICLSSTLPSPVLIVGSVAYDSVATPKHSVERVLGGSASYASVAASFLAPVRLVGIVGHDFALSDRQRFERRGVDIRGLRTHAALPTFFWRGRYDNHFRSRETLETALNAFEGFEPDLPGDYCDSPFIFLGNIEPKLQHRVLDQMRGSPFVMVDTMNFWIHSDERPQLESLLKRVDGLVINDEEAMEWTKESNLILAGRALQQKGVPLVVIKKAEHGVLVMHDQSLFCAPAYPVLHLEDPTGAGDAFAGGVIGALAALGRTDFAAVKNAVLYGTAAASLAIEGFSLDRLERSGAPMLESRVQTLKNMMIF